MTTDNFGDTVGMIPLVKMLTLGHDFITAGPRQVSCAILVAPLVSLLHAEGIFGPRA